MCLSTQVLGHLGTARTHFIRCIRGSKDQQPGEFAREYIAVQLKQLSILETLDQYMNGFPIIYTFSEFIRLYWPLVPEVAGFTRRPQETCRVRSCCGCGMQMCWWGGCGSKGEEHLCESDVVWVMTEYF